MTPEEFTAAQAQQKVMTPEKFQQSQVSTKTPANTGFFETAPYAKGAGFAENAGRALYNIPPNLANIIKGIGNQIINPRANTSEQFTPDQAKEALRSELENLLAPVKHPIKTAVEQPVTMGAIAIPAAKGAAGLATKAIKAAERIPGLNESLIGPEMKTITTIGEKSTPSMLENLVGMVSPRAKSAMKLARTARETIQPSDIIQKKILAYPVAKINPEAAAVVKKALSREREKTGPVVPTRPPQAPMRTPAPQQSTPLAAAEATTAPTVAPISASAPLPEMTPSISASELEKILQERAAQVPRINQKMPDIVRRHATKTLAAHPEPTELSEIENVIAGSKAISPDLAARYGVTPESQALDIKDFLNQPGVPLSLKEELIDRFIKYGKPPTR